MRRVLLFSISALCLALVVSVGLALYTGVRTDAAVVGVVSVPVEKVLCHRFAG